MLLSVVRSTVERTGARLVGEDVHGKITPHLTLLYTPLRGFTLDPRYAI